MIKHLKNMEMNDNNIKNIRNIYCDQSVSTMINVKEQTTAVKILAALDQNASFHHLYSTSTQKKPSRELRKFAKCRSVQ